MTPVDHRFEALLVYLKEARGFDFTGYQRAGMMRRVDRRMTQVQVGGYEEYQEYLQAHPDEFTSLFDAMLINVTAFFRDPDAWEHLRTRLLAPLVAAERDGAPIRIWSAGCASGEEAYTLAMVMAELVGIDRFRDRVKIYATDVDEAQLTRARLATYGERELQAVPPDLLAKYFEPSGNRRVFRADLRRSMVFGRNDLVQDAPISRIDVLTCRNALMYLNAETQAKILGRLHYALRPTGVLFLGKGEMLLSHGRMFAPIDLKHRIFRRVPLPAPAAPEAASTARVPAGGEAVPAPDRLRDVAFAAGPTAQLIITPDGHVALVNRQLEHLFGVSWRDVGRPLRDLDISRRPVELHTHVEQARLERRSLRVTDVEHVRHGETVHLDVVISPLVGTGAGTLGVAVSFPDVTPARRLRYRLENTNQRLDAAYEQLRFTHEQLDTVNEELQSTIEELETTNEELQSTNKELDTMNQELQSTNDELQASNDRLNLSTGRLDDANSFLAAVLSSLHAGVAVVDRELRVSSWNRRAEDLWGLRATEVLGRQFPDLGTGEQLRPLLCAASSAGGVTGEVTLKAVNRGGRTIEVHVACTPLRTQDETRTPYGAIVVMESDDGSPSPDGV